MTTLFMTQYGFRTPTPTNPSRFVSSLTNTLQAIAGPKSVGIVTGGYGVPRSVQFGTNPTETPSNSARTVSSTGLVSSVEPLEVVETLVDGSQSMADGRLYWDASNKALYIEQRKDDAIVSNCPRFQVYLANIFHYHNCMRFILQFKMGTPNTPFQQLSPIGRDNVLIFQINPDVSEVPPFNIQIRKPSNGLEEYRNLAFLRRTDNYSSQPPGGPNDGLIGDGTGESHVLLLENIRKDDVHTVIVDFRADHRDQDEGGAAYIAITYNGVRQQLHPHSGGGYQYTDHSIYPLTTAASGNVLHTPMLGIYRTNYQGVKAPDDTAITFFIAEVQHYAVNPSNSIF